MTTALVIIDVQNAILRGLGSAGRQPAIDATDQGGITFAQIIPHHNAVLDGFSAGAHAIALRAAEDVRF